MTTATRNVSRSLVLLFSITALMAGCGGGGGGGGGTPSPAPAPSAPPTTPAPPSPPAPTTILASEITDAGTDRIAGLALDSAFTLVDVGVLMQRLPIELARLQTPGSGTTTLPCVSPTSPRPQGNSTVTTTSFTDTGASGPSSGDSAKVTYFFCGDSGLPTWNDTNSMDFSGMQIQGNPLVSGDWSVAALTPWQPILNASTGYQVGDRSHGVVGFVDGPVEQVGDRLVATLKGTSPWNVFDVQTRELASGASNLVASRGISVFTTAPVVVERTGSQAYVVNGSAEGTFTVASTPLAWLQNAAISGDIATQGAWVSVKDLRFASLAQVNSRRPNQGTLIVRPSARYGYYVRIDVQDETTLRLRVLSTDDVILSDRQVPWSQAIWDFKTAAN